MVVNTVVKIGVKTKRRSLGAYSAFNFYILFLVFLLESCIKVTVSKLKLMNHNINNMG